MARQRAVDTKIQVTRGFVTEFTPVGFPQEAAIDIDNCIIDVDGSVRRRPGIDLEREHVRNNVLATPLAVGTKDSIAFSTFLWEAVANSGTLNIVVQQLGSVVQFYAQIGAVSANLLGEVDLAVHAIDAAKLPTTAMEMTSGLGAVFIANKYMEPVKVEFDGSVFTVTPILIQQRDFDGLDDGLELDERPTSLDRNHLYNLRNQGWSDDNIKEFANVLPGVNLCATTGNPGGLPAGSGSDFPSNADIMTVGIVVDGSGNLDFDPEFIRESHLGNTPAPKGHFILDSFFKNYDEVSGCAGTGSEITPTRPQAIAFHQGRVFYSSAVVQNRVNGVFYSQNLLSEDKAAKCFQEADPTAEEINDLVATDGGFLPMPGVGEIFQMQELGNGVVCIASNGVWYITGAEVGSAVTATSIRLDKLHASGGLSASSVVQAEDSIYFWGVEGLMQIALLEAGAKVVNITQSSIQSFYINISAMARERTQAVFVPEQRKIYWAYRDSAKDETQTSNSANRFLILDLDVKGFYKFSIAEADLHPEIVGLSLVKPVAAGTVSVEVITETDLTPVTLTDGSTLTEEIEADGAQISTLKVATLVYSTTLDAYQFTFSTFHDSSFTDWSVIDSGGIGLPMSSFVEFAEFNLGALHTRGRPTHVHSYFSRTSKNLAAGGYYELPPRFYRSTGLRLTQSVLEVLHKPQSDLRLAQTVLEVLHKGA